MLNIKKYQSDRGFTIVELLIVIVIIAILAAITIVAYNGIQNRSKTTANQATASQVSKKVQAFYTVASKYPTQAELTGNDGTDAKGGKEAQIDSGITVQNGPLTAAPTDQKTVGYEVCGGTTPTGAKVTYWDYAASTPAAKEIAVGSC